LIEIVYFFLFFFLTSFLFSDCFCPNQMREEVETIEYEAPRSVSPSPASSPHRISQNPSGNNLSAAATATPTPVLAPLPVHAAATPVAAAAAPQAHNGYTSPVPVNQHASVNLLDMDDHVTSAPAGAASTAAAAVPQIALVECAGRFTPVLFQQLWGRLPEAFAGPVCTLSRRPSATAELEAALRTQRIMVMASGPLPPGGPQTGLKLFVYAVGRLQSASAGPEASFLAQMVQVNETGAVSVTVKTDSTGLSATDAATQFVSLLISSLASFIPK
jgi:hypothetical protein